MGKNIRLKFSFLIVGLLTVLIACNRSNPVNYSNFELAPDLLINPELEGLVTMRIDIDSLALTETIENHSNHQIGLGDSSVEYFDGNNWRTVPLRADFEFTAILETVASYDSNESLFDLDWYDTPLRGSFRFRRSIFIDLGSGRPTDLHDLSVEFSLN